MPPAAIHVTPEALEGGVIGKIRDGDIVRLDADSGTLEVLVRMPKLESRDVAVGDLLEYGFGRELFAGFRQLVGRADRGASAFGTA